MAELGIGTRVFVGWTDNVKPENSHCRLKTGTIYDGPTTEKFQGGYAYFWTVQMDVGSKIRAVEHLLSPIDGDEGLNDEPTMSEIPKEEA